MYIKYLKYPAIPVELIKDVRWLIEDSVIPYVAVTNFFKTLTINQDLFNWLQTNLPIDVIHARYQIIFNGITKHKDSTDRVTSVNYLLDCGGDGVMTSVYDDLGIMLQSECIQLNKWHYLPTHLTHDVTSLGFVRPRIAISIDSKKTPNHLFNPADIIL
jgi:hypothetical protein